MALALRGVAEAQAIDGADVTVTLPVGTATNDVVFIGYAIGDTNDRDMSMDTADYAELADIYSSDTLDANLGVFRKVMGATPDSTAVCNGTGNSSDACAAVCQVWTGADTTTPEDATTTTAVDDNSALPDNPAIVTVTANTVVIAFGANSQLDASITAPSGYSDQADIGSDDNDNCTVMVASKAVVATGSEDPAAWTDITTTISHAWAAATVAVRPAAGVTAAITGTATASITESDVVAGGKTVIITLTGDTWVVAAGSLFDNQRQNIIDGLDSAQSEGTGWNTEVRDNQGVAGVVRTSDTVCTITLDAQAAYDITAQETITVTVPSTAVAGGVAIAATPTFTVDIIAGAIAYVANSLMMMGHGR